MNATSQIIKANNLASIFLMLRILLKTYAENDLKRVSFLLGNEVLCCVITRRRANSIFNFRFAFTSSKEKINYLLPLLCIEASLYRAQLIIF